MHSIDEAVVDKAASYIKEQAPDLSWVYLEYTDDMGHMYGDSPRFYKAIQLMDKQMSRLAEAIRYRQKQFGEDWLLIITTDHGRDAKTGKNHGGQSDRERSGWIVTNARNLNEYYQKGNISIADIMPTIAHFLKIRIPKEKSMEIDGTPLIGKMGAANLQASEKDGKINVHWQPYAKNEKGKIWLATTNNFKTGTKDNYELVVELPLNKGQTEFNAGKSSTGFYKIVLETPYNILNRWIMPSKN
jgi:arylsulfatase A-like enzyme